MRAAVAVAAVAGALASACEARRSGRVLVAPWPPAGDGGGCICAAAWPVNEAGELRLTARGRDGRQLHRMWRFSLDRRRGLRPATAGGAPVWLDSSNAAASAVFTCQPGRDCDAAGNASASLVADWLRDGGASLDITAHASWASLDAAFAALETAMGWRDGVQHAADGVNVALDSVLGLLPLPREATAHIVHSWLTSLQRDGDGDGDAENVGEISDVSVGGGGVAQPAAPARRQAEPSIAVAQSSPDASHADRPAVAAAHAVRLSLCIAALPVAHWDVRRLQSALPPHILVNRTAVGVAAARETGTTSDLDDEPDILVAAALGSAPWLMAVAATSPQEPLPPVVLRPAAAALSAAAAKAEGCDDLTPALHAATSALLRLRARAPTASPTANGNDGSSDGGGSDEGGSDEGGQIDPSALLESYAAAGATFPIPGLMDIIKIFMKLLMPPVMDPLLEKANDHLEHTLSETVGKDVQATTPKDTAAMLEPDLRRNLTNLLVDTVTAAVTPELCRQLTATLAPELVEQLVALLQPDLHGRLTRALQPLLVTRFDATLPAMLRRSLRRSLADTLTTALTHTLVPSLALVLLPHLAPRDREHPLVVALSRECASCGSGGSAVADAAKCWQCRADAVRQSVVAHAHHASEYYSGYFRRYYAQAAVPGADAAQFPPPDPPKR